MPGQVNPQDMDPDDLTEEQKASMMDEKAAFLDQLLNGGGDGPEGADMEDMEEE